MGISSMPMVARAPPIERFMLSRRCARLADEQARALTAHISFLRIIAFGRLHRNLPQEKLDLLQLASRRVAQPSAGPATDRAVPPNRC